MRMRRKSWARPELAASDFYIQEPVKHRGAWKDLFADPFLPRHLELGCGKGVSTAQMVHENKDINYVAIDLISDVLATARRNISETYGDEPVDNVLITSYNVLSIRNIFAPEDAFERIIISFCNPWNGRPRHWKRRLTHTQQLMQYREFLTERGEIWFKTDDDELFRSSLQYFKESGFSIRHITYDLHASGFTPNYISEHEAFFTAKGVKIKFLIAVKEDLPCATQPSATSSATENI